MRKDTVIFLNAIPFTTVTEKRLNMPAYKKAGFRTIYLDLSEYYFPDRRHNYVSANRDYIVKADYIIKCRNKKEILEWIKKESERSWFYIAYRNFNYTTEDIWLFRVFKKYNCDYFVTLDCPQYDPSDKLIDNYLKGRHYVTHEK